MRTLYPEIEPFRTGRLRVSELHEIFYEEVGKSGGLPAVFLHGGPGVGIIPQYRRFFDPAIYHLVLPDQRGAGRSTPHAELRENTTWDLVDDLEKLRLHLNLGPWVVMGGSWGSMLALCYAIRYPESVRAIAIRGICLGRRFEDQWLHAHGASEVYPDEWERYQALIPPTERDDMIAAYHRRMTEGDESSRLQAAQAWSRWEGAMADLVPSAETIDSFEEIHRALSIGRIESSYTLHHWFLPSDNFILDNAHRLSNIPLRLVQGRYDMICPVRAAWDLHKALPHSDLRIVPLGAHSPLDEGMLGELVQATEDFKQLPR
jgi:proline iminopeptidase